MKFFLISDNIDTKIGMRLAGIDGVVVHERDELIEAFGSAAKNKEIAVILISEKLVRLAPKYIEEYKIGNGTPLIVELPDRHGSDKPSDYILNYVRDAIGVKI